MGSFTIGRLAETAGVNVETVRYYERRGLLEQPPRPGQGYRQYSDADVWRLQFIRRGKDLGFTLAEIAELLGPEGDGRRRRSAPPRRPRSTSSTSGFVSWGRRGPASSSSPTSASAATAPTVSPYSSADRGTSLTRQLVTENGARRAVCHQFAWGRRDRWPASAEDVGQVLEQAGLAAGADESLDEQPR